LEYGHWIDQKGRLEDNIKMDIRKMGHEDPDGWMELTRNRVQLRALALVMMNLRVLLPEGL